MANPEPIRMELSQFPIHAHGCIKCGRSVPCDGPYLCDRAPNEQVDTCLICLFGFGGAELPKKPGGLP